MQGRKGCSEEEVLAVLGHELGHWSMSHNLKLLGIYQVGQGRARVGGQGMGRKVRHIRLTILPFAGIVKCLV